MEEVDQEVPVQVPPNLLLDLPDLVVREHLLQCLSPTDLLRLGRVHPKTRSWLDDSSSHKAIAHSFSAHPHLLEIAQSGPNSIPNLLLFKSPNPLNFCTQIFIKNRSWDCFSDPQVLQTLMQIAPQLTHLSVQKYYLSVNPSERSFYSNLVNLTHFEAEIIDATALPAATNKPTNEVPPPPPPPIPFTNIEDMAIGRIIYSKRQPQRQFEQRLFIRRIFFSWFHSLKCFRCPREEASIQIQSFLRQISPECLKVPFLHLFPGMFENSDSRALTELDMRSIKEPAMDIQSFLLLTVTAYKTGTLLHNVPSFYYHAADGVYWEFIRQLRHALPPQVADLSIQLVLTFAVQSIINVVPLMFRVGMPQLTRITMTTCHNSYHDLHARLSSSAQYYQEHWPSLEEVDLNINSLVMGADLVENEEITSADDTDVFLRYLFGTPGSRPVMKSVRLDFLQLTEPINWFEGDWFVKNVGLACFNMTKLELCGWKGDGLSLVPFWYILRHLKELVLVKCERVNDDTFFGVEADRKNGLPMFLRLSKLRSLVLKGLDKMPGITDRTFHEVIRHLSLTNFELTSDAPLQTVTYPGIESLLTGPFAESIETFPFCRWSLQDVTLEKFLELGDRFRSSQLKVFCNEHRPGDNSHHQCERCSVISWSMTDQQ